MKPYEPFEVRWRLARPIRSPNDPIHLDALLAWAAVAEARDAGHPDPTTVQHVLPLERYTPPDNSRWVFKASMLKIVPPTGGTPFDMQLTRPTRLPEYARAASNGEFKVGSNRITLGSGPYKSHLFSHRTEWVNVITAFGIGDKERVRMLLARVKSIGKLRRHFLGAVESMEVLDSSDFNAWSDRLMPNPFGETPAQVESYAPMVGALRPPYWDRTCLTTVYRIVQ